MEQWQMTKETRRGTISYCMFYTHKKVNDIQRNKRTKLDILVAFLCVFTPNFPNIIGRERQGSDF